MRMSQLCKNELQAQYSFTYQAQYLEIHALKKKRKEKSI